MVATPAPAAPSRHLASQQAGERSSARLSDAKPMLPALSWKPKLTTHPRSPRRYLG